MSDYIYLLASRIRPDQQQLLAHVQQAAERAQMNVFLTGGAIRDLLGGFRIRDLDFSVEGPALKVVKHLEPGLFKVRSSDESRQSAELVYKGTETAEIAMSRREHYAKTGAQPEIARATIQDDLRRRDFSVNAMALSLNRASRGLLLDPTNGLADIERKELRTLYNYSFYDDPIRLLRMVRLAARLNYGVEERTKSQFESAREAGVEEHITARARSHELRQLAAEPEGAEAVKALASADLLGVFEPHLAKKLDLAAIARLDKYRKLVEESGVRVDNFGPFLYCLTRKLSASERSNLKSRAGLRGADASSWTELESRAKALQKLLAGKQTSQNSRLYKILAAQDPAVAFFLLAFSPLQPVRDKIKNYFTQLRPMAASVTDRDIEQLGVKRDSSKFPGVREAYVLARLDKKIGDNRGDPAKVLAAELKSK